MRPGQYLLLFRKKKEKKKEKKKKEKKKKDKKKTREKTCSFSSSSFLFSSPFNVDFGGGSMKRDIVGNKL